MEIVEWSEKGDEFLIRRGIEDQLGLGAQRFFSYHDLTFKATLKEISRFYSLWELTTPQTSLKPLKGEFLTFHHSVLIEVPKETKSLSSKSSLPTPTAQNTTPNWTWGLSGQAGMGINQEMTVGKYTYFIKGSHGNALLYLSYALYPSFHLGPYAAASFFKGQYQDSTVSNDSIDHTNFIFGGQISYNFMNFDKPYWSLWTFLRSGLGPSYTQISEGVSTGFSYQVAQAGVLSKFPMGGYNFFTGFLSASLYKTQESFADSSSLSINFFLFELGIGFEF